VERTDTEGWKFNKWHSDVRTNHTVSLWQAGGKGAHFAIRQPNCIVSSTQEQVCGLTIAKTTPQRNSLCISSGKDAPTSTGIHHTVWAGALLTSFRTSFVINNDDKSQSVVKGGEIMSGGRGAKGVLLSKLTSSLRRRGTIREL